MVTDGTPEVTDPKPPTVELPSASTAALGVSIGKKGNNKKDVIVDNKNTKAGIK